MNRKILVGLIVSIALVVLGSFYFLRDNKIEITNFPPKNTTIVAFGDSLVEGVGSTEGNDFVSVLEKKLGVEIINLGVAGDTTAGGLRRADEVSEYDPGIVILLLGGNDALRRIPLETTKENLKTLIGGFQKEGALVVLLGVRGGLVSDPYDEMYEDLADEYKTAYVPNVLSGILLRSELTADQIHPNDKGYLIVAQRVSEVVSPLLKK